MIFDFDDVTKAVEMVEGAIERTKNETRTENMRAALAAAANPGHDFRTTPVFGPMSVAMWKSDITFPMILRNSLLIAIYSHVEHLLRRWCRGLHKEWSLAQDFRQFSKKKSGPIPDLCLEYIRDEGGLAIGDFRTWSEWDAIDSYRVARNCLAHDGGAVDDPTDRAKIGRLTNIQIDTSGMLAESPTIVLLPGACENAVGVMQRFADRLLEAYKQDPRSAR